MSVGYKNQDPKTIKVKNYLDDVVWYLEENGAILEGRTIKFSVFDGGKYFYQGSYATRTAIKHRSYEVDADIGFITTSDGDINLRERIYRTLCDKFSKKYFVVKKKPCITIDFNDGYKIDIALYSVSNNVIYFHNAITGVEEKTKSKPKEFVDLLVDYFKENDMRKLIRLSKHFLKTISEKLEIDDVNRIPSVSLSIFAYQNFQRKSVINNENDLQNNLEHFLLEFYSYVKINGTNGPRLDDLYVSNTFYKIKDIEETLGVLSNACISLSSKNFAQLISREIFESINRKDQLTKTNPLIGTLGNNG